MRKGKILTKISHTTEKAIEKHSTIFMKKKFYILAGILATCLAMSVGRVFAQPIDPTTAAITAVNMAWTLAMGGLVWFMQLGFAYLGAGFTEKQKPGQLLGKKLH